MRDASASPLRSVPGTSPITAFRLLGDRARVEAMQGPDHAFTAASVACVGAPL